MRRAFLLAWAALLLSVVNDSWAITAFNVDIGPFSDSRSWDNGVPTVSNIGWMNNGGTATGGDEIIGPFTLLIDDGAVDFELPKLQGVNIAQAGGSWSSSDSTILGWDVVHDQDTHDPAIYALHAEFSAGNELVIGRNANATMDHQNGTVTVTNALRIGSVANSARSTYSITDGTVTAGDLIFSPSSVDGRISPSFNFVERSAGKLNVLNSNYSEQDGLDDIVAGNITGKLAEVPRQHQPQRRRLPPPAQTGRIRAVQAIRFHEQGPPSVLQLDELPDPQPGPGQVRRHCLPGSSQEAIRLVETALAILVRETV